MPIQEGSRVNMQTPEFVVQELCLLAIHIFSEESASDKLVFVNLAQLDTCFLWR